MSLRSFELPDATEIVQHRLKFIGYNFLALLKALLEQPVARLYTILSAILTMM